jgi:hypothetical protein
MKTLEQIVRQLVALPDPDTTPNLSPKQVRDLVEEKRVLEGRIGAIRVAINRLAELDAQIAPVEIWLGYLAEWRKTLCEQLAAHTEPTTSDYHEHRASHDRLAALQLSIANIDRGCQYFGSMCELGRPIADLMRAAGYAPEPGQNDIWSAGYGSTAQAQRRLDELTKQRTEVQARLDSELCAAKKTLTV